MTPTKLIQVTCALLLNQKQEFLLCQRNPHQSHAGLWEFPGGKVESGETLFQALHREIQEELSLDIKCHRIFTHQQGSTPHGPIRLTAIWCEWLQGALTLREHQSFAWVKCSALTSYPLSPADLAIVQKLQNTPLDSFWSSK